VNTTELKLRITRVRHRRAATGLGLSNPWIDHDQSDTDRQHPPDQFDMQSAAARRAIKCRPQSEPHSQTISNQRWHLVPTARPLV
jgi:hypothetical protein